MDLSRKTPKKSINDVLALVINELESSWRCTVNRVMQQKLLINGFFIHRESMRLILKELHDLGAKQRTRHNLTKRTDISTDPNNT